MLVSQMSTAEEVLKEIESRSQKEFLPIVGPVKGKLLADLVRDHRPKRVVEVGALVGYSAILIGLHLPTGGRLTTLEIDPRLARMAQKNVERAGLAARIEIVVGEATSTIGGLVGPFQFAFLDAAKEEYLDYLNLLEPKLAKGSIIVADNAGMFAKAMAAYLRYVRRSPKYQSSFHDFGFDGMEVSIKLE